MRLKVSPVGPVPGTLLFWFSAKPDRKASEQEMKSVAYRITLLGREVLGEDFHSTNTEPSDNSVNIYVAKDIASGPKELDFKAFIGWVEIFGMETGLSTRASVPRAN